MANEEKKHSKRLPGFYIALCCCVLVIGVAGYFTEKASKPNSGNDSFDQEQIIGSVIDDNNKEEKGEVISVSEIKPVEENSSAQAPESEPIQEDIPQESPEPDFAVDNPDVMETAVRVEAEEEYFAFPASGDILEAFSTELKYNEPLGDYRTHNGIDIAADEGCSISAAADGTVEDIFTNAFGDGISIIHNNNILTKYMCLGAVEDLEIGDTVKAGDVIGTVGKSKGENVKDSHLHFEMYKNGEAIDPCEYLR